MEYGVLYFIVGLISYWDLQYAKTYSQNNCLLLLEFVTYYIANIS